MEGTEKQIKWAEQIRSEFLVKLGRGQKARGFEPPYSEEDYNAIVAAAMAKTKATWWIDNRLDGVDRMASNVLGRSIVRNIIF